MKKVGIGNVVAGAMNQAFFTLSRQSALWPCFGSYDRKGARTDGRVCPGGGA